MTNNNIEINNINEIENKLENFKNNNSILDSKYNDDVYSFNLEEEKKFIKEIKLLSNDNIQTIKNIKNLILSLNNNNNSNNDNNKLTIFKDSGLLNIIESFKSLIKYFYKGQCYYKERLTLKMFQQYRIIKSDLKDEEILKALQDSSPDQIFYKTSFGFNFNDTAKSALVYIQYRHHDLKELNSTIKEIQSTSKEFNINWDLSIESTSFSKNKRYRYINNDDNINNNNNYNSPSISSSITISGINNNNNENNNINKNCNNKKNKEEQDIKDSVQYIKKQLRSSTSNSRKFLIFNLWCCGEQ